MKALLIILVGAVVITIAVFSFGIGKLSESKKYLQKNVNAAIPSPAYQLPCAINDNSLVTNDMQITYVNPALNVGAVSAVVVMRCQGPQKMFILTKIKFKEITLPPSLVPPGQRRNVTVDNHSIIVTFENGLRYEYIYDDGEWKKYKFLDKKSTIIS